VLHRTASKNIENGNLYYPSSSLADENGFRKDYINAMKELKVTNMRWLGGNFVMGYNWQDGIGPKNQRPARINLAWGGIDNNHVGTDEWIALNKSFGSENIVCVNLGLATIQDACYWVEYCNYKKGTYYSDLRIKYGHEKSYDIKIWDFGNEVPEWKALSNSDPIVMYLNQIPYMGKVPDEKSLEVLDEYFKWRRSPEKEA
jgi:alpha-L-arabinofuranosidase